MKLMGPERKVFPLAVRELIDGGSAPRDGIKLVAALDRVAACEHVVDCHDADDPCRNYIRHNDGRNDRVFVEKWWLEALARYRIKMVNNRSIKNANRRLTIQESDIVFEECEWVRNGGLGYVAEKREHSQIRRLEICCFCVQSLKSEVHPLRRRV